ncbi:MAG: PQQ-binding-like beta-propeller repeat protein [Planctomycetes bacterium]|nr:PQQ-binding-like beta-propeller repeat protein [Planctomycetota bacterium]
MFTANRYLVLGMVAALVAAVMTASSFARNPQSVAFSPDGKIAALGIGGSPPSKYTRIENEGHIDLWNSVTGEPIRRIPFHGDIPDLAFSRDGKFLAAVSLYTPGDSVDGNAVRVFRTASGEKVHSFGRGVAFAFSPRADLIAVAAASSTTLYDTRTFEGLISFADLNRTVSSLQFSPDGQTLAAVCRDKDSCRIRLCETATGKMLRKSDRIEPCYQAVWSPEGKQLACGGDGSVRLYKAATLKKEHALETDLEGLLHPCFSPVGGLLAVAGQQQGELLLFNTKTRKQVGKRSFESGAFKTVCARFAGTSFRPEFAPKRIAFSPDGAALLLGYDKGLLIHVTSGEVKYHLPSDAIEQVCEEEDNLYAMHLRSLGIEADAKGIAAFLNSLQPTVEQRGELAKQIEFLGSDTFELRDQASRLLQPVVLVFRQELTEALGSKDRETSLRAAALLRHARELTEGPIYWVLKQITREQLPAAPAVVAAAPLFTDDPYLLCAARQAVRAGAVAQDTEYLRKVIKGEHPAAKKLATAALVALNPAAGSKDTQTQPEWARILVWTVRGAVVEVDERGKRTAEFHSARHSITHAAGLANGHRLVSYYRGDDCRVREYDVAGAEIWDSGRMSSYVSAACRSPNGDTIVGMLNVHQLRAISAKGKEVWRRDFPFRQEPFDVRLLDNGHLLVAQARAGRVVELDETVTEVTVLKDLPDVVSAQRLANGNTLVGLRQSGEVKELNAAGRLVWSTAGFGQLRSVQRLPCGGTMIASRVNGVVIVDRAGRIVRQLKNIDSRGVDGAAWY